MPLIQLNETLLLDVAERCHLIVERTTEEFCRFHVLLDGWQCLQNFRHQLFKSSHFSPSHFSTSTRGPARRSLKVAKAGILQIRQSPWCPVRDRSNTDSWDHGLSYYHMYGVPCITDNKAVAAKNGEAGAHNLWSCPACTINSVKIVRPNCDATTAVLKIKITKSILHHK